jgi:hypothetical protein
MSQNPYPSNGAINSTGVRVPLRAGDLTGSLRVNQHVGDKYAYALGKVLYSASNAAAADLSAGLATTYTGLCLSNLSSSLVNLSIRRVSAQFIVAPAAFLAVGLITGGSQISVHTTPVTPLASYVGDNTASKARVDAACTLTGTPTWARWLSSSSATGIGPSAFVDLEGGLLLPPGSYCAIGANVAGPAAGFLGTFEWIEIPVATP